MADNILTQDPTKPGVLKANGPTLASGNKIPLSGLDTTGAVNGNVVKMSGGVWAPGTDSGSSDTASNVGAGTGTIFKQKTGANFEFKTLIAGTNVTLTNGASDITINASTVVTGIFTLSFTSGPQVISNAGTLTIAHGLGVKPTLDQCFIVCTTAEHGYSIGDELPVKVADTGTFHFQIERNSTNVIIYFAAQPTPEVGVAGNGSGTSISFTNASWQFYVRCWA